MSAGSAGILNRGKKGQFCFLESSITYRRLYTFKRIMTSFTWGTPAYKLPFRLLTKDWWTKTKYSFILNCSNRQQGCWRQIASLLSNTSAHFETPGQGPICSALSFFKSPCTFHKNRCLLLIHKQQNPEKLWNWLGIPTPEKATVRWQQNSLQCLLTGHLLCAGIVLAAALGHWGKGTCCWGTPCFLLKNQAD